jgi:hypothetical protein
MDDLGRAEEIADVPVDATPQKHPDRAMYSNDLASQLGMRIIGRNIKGGLTSMVA